MRAPRKDIVEAEDSSDEEEDDNDDDGEPTVFQMVSLEGGWLSQNISFPAGIRDDQNALNQGFCVKMPHWVYTDFFNWV